MNKLELYRYLVKNPGSTSETMAIDLGYAAEDIEAMLAADTSAFMVDPVSGEWTTVENWVDAPNEDVKVAVTSLAELFALAKDTGVGENPDELAIFLQTNGITPELAADGEYVCKEMGKDGGELDQMVTKFGFDIDKVPGGAQYIATLKQQFIGIAAILHAIKLQ